MSTYEKLIKQIERTAAREGATPRVLRAAQNAALAHLLRREYRIPPALHRLHP